MLSALGPLLNHSELKLLQLFYFFFRCIASEQAAFPSAATFSLKTRIIGTTTGLVINRTAVPISPPGFTPI